MRTYLIMKEKAEQWNADNEIQAILKEIYVESNGVPKTGVYSKKSSEALLAHAFDKDAILQKGLPYERLDQLTVDLLLGIRCAERESDHEN